MRLSPLEAFDLFCFLRERFFVLFAFFRERRELRSDVVQFRAVLTAESSGCFRVCRKVVERFSRFAKQNAFSCDCEFFFYFHDFFSLSPPSGGIHKI